MQTIYRHSFVAGVAGLPYNHGDSSRPRITDTRAVEGDNMRFGVAVFRGSRPGENVSRTGTVFAGISENTWTKELDRDGKSVHIREGDAIGVNSMGSTWVVLTQGASPTYGQAAAYTEDGLFTTHGTVIPNARFITGDNGEGLAVVEIR